MVRTVNYWKQVLDRISFMDITALSKFETLTIGSNHVVPKQINAETKTLEAKATKRDESCIPSLKSSSDSEDHDFGSSHQFQQNWRLRKQSKPVVPAEVAKKVQWQSCQRAGPRQEPSHPQFTQHGDRPNSLVGEILQPHLGQLNPKAVVFEPHRRVSNTAGSETKLIPHRDEVSLSTPKATVEWTLPEHSRESIPQIQPFPSSKANFRGPLSRDSIRPKKKDVAWKIKNSDDLIHLPAPNPTKAYLTEAAIPASRLHTPQRLLIILDLNGTLLFRTSRSTSYVPRPGLDNFLDYCFSNHSVMIWSSARPHNVEGVCQRIFKPAQRRLLLGQWSRDTLGLTAEQYVQRVQVYKRLDTVWSKQEIQSHHPTYATGGRWGQYNTVLIDDSVLKAAKQPFNLVRVPEFVKVQEALEPAKEVLEQVRSRLDKLSMWNNVSAVLREQHSGDGQDSKTANHL